MNNDSSNPRFANITVQSGFSHIEFLQPLNTISNAPYLGGVFEGAAGILNLKVDKTLKENNETEPHLSITKTFDKTLDEIGLPSPCIGLMTAASMKSFRSSYEKFDQYEFLFAVTCGLSNSRRIGDPADASFSDALGTLPPGTINLIFATSLPLSPSAQLEAFALLTEAKTAACYDKGIRSRKTESMATGTGTDATVVASARHHETSQIVPYCGKHTKVGEIIGGNAYRIICDTLQACLDSD